MGGKGGGGGASLLKVHHRELSYRGGGGGEALRYGLAIMCPTTLGSGGGGRDSKGEIPPPYKINNRWLKPPWMTVSLCVYSNI